MHIYSMFGGLKSPTRVPRYLITLHSVHLINLGNQIINIQLPGKLRKDCDIFDINEDDGAFVISEKA